jgi:phage replication-related protein YjqB (UPF0714/DUF867 family)
MATYSASVVKALASQKTLIGRGEHCSADPGSLAGIGRALGQQVRVNRDDGELALYTVSEVRSEEPSSLVRMAEAARARLGSTDTFEATVDSQVPHPTYSDAEAEAHGEFVERLRVGAATELVVIAPHGGAIEEWTDRQAERVAATLVDADVCSWVCKGWRTGGGAHARWHITSTDISEESFPLLQTIAATGFTHAVAFHGFTPGDGDPDVLVGGLADDALKAEVVAALQRALDAAAADLTVNADPSPRLGANSPRNIVNRLAEQGVQVEQSLQARKTCWREIADAVADVYRPRVGTRAR